MFHRASVLALSLLLASFAMVMPTATAAGDSQNNAILIGEGTHNGSVAEDENRWYRVDVPAGKALHVAYTRDGGASWNQLGLVDASGVAVARVYSGQSGAFDPDEPSAWILPETFWGSLTYTFTVSLIVAASQDDAGSGKDAGQNIRHALPVAPGRIHGALLAASGDVGDWYRVDVRAGDILDVHSLTAEMIEIYRQDGTRIGEIVSYDSSWTPRAFSTLADGLPYYFSKTYGSTYAFTVEATPRADLRVDDITIRELEVTTDAAGTSLSTAREVVVTMTNSGEGPSRDGFVEVRTVGTGTTASRWIGRMPVDLAPGEQQTLTIPWDTMGQVGDFRVIGTLINGFEAAPADNAREAAATVLVGGTTRGVDVLNHQVNANGQKLGMEYGHRVGIYAAGKFIGYADGTIVLG